MVNTRSGPNDGEHSGGNNGNNTGVPDVARLLQDLVTAATQIAGNTQGGNHNGRQHQPQGAMTRGYALSEFCKRRPPAFMGEPKPVEAENWLKEIKVILQTLGIVDDGHRVALTTYQQKGEARNWWETMEATHNIETMTFAEFEG